MRERGGAAYRASASWELAAMSSTRLRAPPQSHPAGAAVGRLRGATDGCRERLECPADGEPQPARHRGDPRQRDDDVRRGGVRRARGPRRSAPSLPLRRPKRPKTSSAACRPVAGNPVVTGPKIGLRASRDKDRANKIFDARVMTRWYGAPQSLSPQATLPGRRARRDGSTESADRVPRCNAAAVDGRRRIARHRTPYSR